MTCHLATMFCFRNPNLPTDDRLKWHQYTSSQQHYLKIARDMTSSNVKQRLNTRRANFWAHLIPALAKVIQYSNCENIEMKTCQRDSFSPWWKYTSQHCIRLSMLVKVFWNWLIVLYSMYNLHIINNSHSIKNRTQK